MNFQQLRYVSEALRNDLNLTEASQALNTSQSGVSKQIRELETELGAEIFVRKGKRLTGLTRVGAGLVKLIDRVLLDVENLKRYPEQFAGNDVGQLVIATTHNQGRYTLPSVVSHFATQHPDVRLQLQHTTPLEAARSVASGEADLAIATEALDQSPDLVHLKCFSWRHLVVAPEGHPLTEASRLTLADIARWPLVTYCPEFSGRSQVDAAFREEGLAPDIRVGVMDAEDIKDYVLQGLGVGIISEMAVSARDSSRLIYLNETKTLFEPSITKIAFKKGALLHTYAYHFITLLAPQLNGKSFGKSGLDRVKSIEDAAAQADLPEFAELEQLRAEGENQDRSRRRSAGETSASRSHAHTSEALKVDGRLLLAGVSSRRRGAMAGPPGG